MEKTKIFQYFKNANNVHKSWIIKAKMLINDNPIQADFIPMTADSCEFGQWFNYEGKKLFHIASSPTEDIENITLYHKDFHDYYAKIYNMYYKYEKNSFLNRFFGLKKKINEKEKKSTLAYLIAMEEASKKLMEELNKIENQIQSRG